MNTSGFRVDHRVSRSKKRSKEWYKPLCDYIIGQIDSGAIVDIQDRKNILKGNISDSYYKKVLNPFNAVDPKYTRHRADMRNFDIMQDVIRRYLGEYSKQPFDFQVKANDPDVVTRFNDAFFNALSKLAVQAYINELNSKGIDTGQQNVEVPDFNVFYQNFKDNYIDEVAAQGQELLTAIIDWTESKLKYYKAFYDYIVLGQTFTYRDIRNGVLYKEVIDPERYHPISNGEAFIEDHDKGVRDFSVTVPQLLNNFGDILDETTFNRIKDLFDKYGDRRGSVSVPLAYFKSLLDEKEYATFVGGPTTTRGKITNDTYRLTNKDDMLDGYHIVFTTEVKVGNLLYLDPVLGVVQQDIIEDDSFELKPELGHISIEWEWWNEVWEMYRFGNEHDDIYTIPRPVAYQRRDGNNPQNVKLPYNGLCELIPGTGFTFSIPDAIFPFQLSRNIFSFYREKIIAKNKDKILVVPESLLGDENQAEDKIYRLEANSVFTYDDAEDDSGIKAQQIRVVDASLSQFVSHITDLIDRMKQEAWDTVDMNAQRYGDINTSAGKATTEEAIVRSSMGSVIIFSMFEKLLEKEYVADLEYSKMAYVNGKSGSYTDLEGNSKFFDLDVEKHLLANYGLHVVSSVSQTEKKRALRDIGLAASQNGNFGLAAKSILADNVSAINKAFNEFERAEKEYQRAIASDKERLNKEAESIKAQNDQANRDNEYNIALLKEQGDMQRAIVEAEVELIKLEGTLASAPEGTNTSGIQDQISTQKLELDRLKQSNDMQKHRDNINVKREEMQSKERIAKENKNKYDNKGK